MIHIQKTFSNTIEKMPSETTLFFDIETTGLSREREQLYLIGCAFRKGNQMVVEQFFAESMSEEAKLLEAFEKLSQSFEKLVTFCGSSFDLPFLIEKCKQWELPHSFSLLEHLDLHKTVTSLKAYVQLENYKQKTVEKALGIHRIDTYSGKELIRVYKEYQKSMQQQFLLESKGMANELQDCRQKLEQEKEILLLHNEEDVVGLYQIYAFTALSDFLDGDFDTATCHIERQSQELRLVYEIKHRWEFPLSIQVQKDGFHLCAQEQHATLSIPIFEGELLYFYPDFKNYFYLPQEDMAIHKSVASFVDAKFRKQAKAANCYTRKSGQFLPQFDLSISPVFYERYKGKMAYVLLSEEFLESEKQSLQYLREILKKL